MLGKGYYCYIRVNRDMGNVYLYHDIHTYDMLIIHKVSIYL